MKKHILSTFFLLCTINCFAQSPSVIPKVSAALSQQGSKKAGKDTVIESDTMKENKEPRYFYFSLNTNAFVNSKGGFPQRFNHGIEIGRTYGIFDIGLATGKFDLVHFTAADSTRYLEIRPAINVFSKGRFAEALCLGGGYVFASNQAFMTEICNSINFSATETMEIAITQGYYYFDGTNSSRTAQYIGLSFTYNFLKKHSVNIQRKKEAIISDK